MEIAVTRVERTDSRKTRITTTANSRPRAPSVARSWIDSSMNGAWSKTTVRLSPDTSSVSSSMASLSAWETATTSASWVAVIEIERASSPFMRVIEVCSSVTRSTSATSAMVTTLPCWVWAPGDISSGPSGVWPASGKPWLVSGRSWPASG